MYCQYTIYGVLYNSYGDDMKKTYVEIIRELREDNDLKQCQVAEFLKTTQQVYSRYEKGTNEIPVRHIISLAKFYNVSCDYILGETNNKKRYPK